MTKAAVEALTRNIAVVYGPYGIRANTVSPGAVLTPVLEKSFLEAPDPQKRREGLETISPLKRIGLPHEIAEVVLFYFQKRPPLLLAKMYASMVAGCLHSDREI